MNNMKNASLIFFNFLLYNFIVQLIVNISYFELLKKYYI